MKRIPRKLPFVKADLRLPVAVRKVRCNSISGVQAKVLLALEDGEFRLVESGGDFILKPVPQDSESRFAADIPANEHLTMRIAHEVFGIETAENCCIRFADGELAYLPRRFDRREGCPVRQEDLCQLAGRSEETHGSRYKYDFSYEEMAEIIRAAVPSARIELPKVFRQIFFDYVFANGDAHLKNFSLLESPQGDYILTPAYDLLNTAIHFPNEPSAVGLDFFADGHFTPRYEELGFYSSADFIELGRCFGVEEKAVRKLLAGFPAKAEAVEKAVAESFLSESAREIYLERFRDRLKAVDV